MFKSVQTKHVKDIFGFLPLISLALIIYFDQCRSSLKFNLSGLAERGQGVEYSCQSTANCLPSSLNTSGHCEGVRSSTLLSLEYGPENIRLSHQVREETNIQMFNSHRAGNIIKTVCLAIIEMLRQSVRFS